MTWLSAQVAARDTSYRAGLARDVWFAVFVVIACAALGALVVVEPAVGAGVGAFVLGCLALATTRTPTSAVVSVIMLGALVTLARAASVFGASVGVPIVDVLLGVLILVRAKAAAQTIRHDRTFAALAVLWLFWVVITMCRLTADWERYGVLAARDSDISLEFGAILLAASFATAPRKGVRRSVLMIGDVAASFTVLYPVRQLLMAHLSPALGSILEFGNVGVVGATLLLSAGVLRGWRRWFWTASGAAAVVFSQSRMMYLIVPIGVLIMVAVYRKGGHHERSFSVVPAVVMLAAVVSVGALIPGSGGRLGAVSATNLQDQFVSVFKSDQTKVGGSIEDRKRWWPDVWSRLNQNLMTEVSGLGLGPDLIHGFKNPDGQLVRKPHNDFLEAVARVGIPAGSALAVITVTALAIGFRRLRGGELEEVFCFIWLLAAAGTAFSQPYFAYAHGAIPAAFAAGMIICRRGHGAT